MVKAGYGFPFLAKRKTRYSHLDTTFSFIVVHPFIVLILVCHNVLCSSWSKPFIFDDGIEFNTVTSIHVYCVVYFLFIRHFL